MRHGRHDNGIARTGFGARTLRRSVARRTGAAPPDQDNAASSLASHQNEIGRLQNAHNGHSVSSKVSRALLVKVKPLLYFLYLYAGYVALRDLLLSILGRSRAVVIYYHRVGPTGVLSKPVGEFQNDLAYIKQHYECITLAELSERLLAGSSFRRRAAVITFDDGYRDNYREAVPALKAAGLPATFFVATGYIGTRREFHHDHRANPPTAIRPSFPKLEWADLRAMERDGFEIGSHTVNHTDLGQASAAEIEFEVVSSLATLEHCLGHKPRPFSFPWGKPAQVTDEALQAVRTAGYYASCSAYGGMNTRGGDPFRIMRVDVGNGELGRLATRARIAGLDPDRYRVLIGRLLRGD